MTLYVYEQSKAHEQAMGHSASHCKREDATDEALFRLGRVLVRVISDTC